jgi:hypothetical protein
MNAVYLEDLKEEVCAQLYLGRKNGETELETMVRIVWKERQKYFTVPVSERLQQFYETALQAVRKPVTAPVERERPSDSRKGKLLEWKTCSLAIAESPDPLDPSAAQATAGKTCGPY